VFVKDRPSVAQWYWTLGTEEPPPVLYKRETLFLCRQSFVPLHRALFTETTCILHFGDRWMAVIDERGRFSFMGVWQRAFLNPECGCAHHACPWHGSFTRWIPQPHLSHHHDTNPKLDLLCGHRGRFGAIHIHYSTVYTTSIMQPERTRHRLCVLNFHVCYSGANTVTTSPLW